MASGAAIILIDHGSKDPVAHAALQQVAELLAQRLQCSVGIAHLSLAEPSLEQAVAAVADAQPSEIIVAPIFLFPGQHTRQDIPQLVEGLRQRHPDISIYLGEPLGVDDLLVDLVVKRIRPFLPGLGSATG